VLQYIIFSCYEWTRVGSKWSYKGIMSTSGSFKTYFEHIQKSRAKTWFLPSIRVQLPFWNSLINEFSIFRDEHQFFTNNLIKESLIYRDGCLNFVNDLINKSLIFKDKHQIFWIAWSTSLLFLRTNINFLKKNYK
jgi:hypothetical protein